MADIKKNNVLVTTAKKSGINFCFTERVQTGTETYVTGTTNYTFSQCIRVWSTGLGTMGSQQWQIYNYSNLTVRCTVNGVTQTLSPSGSFYVYATSGGPSYNPNEIVASVTNYGTSPVYSNVRRARLIKSAV